MSVEENKAVVRRWNEQSWKDGDALYDEVIAQDAVFHGIEGPEDIRSALSTFRAAVSDLAVTIDDQLAEGDKVATRWTVRGTHRGELWGVPATGRTVTYTGITINRLAGGRIVEDWFVADVAGLMEQIEAP